MSASQDRRQSTFTSGVSGPVQSKRFFFFSSSRWHSVTRGGQQEIPNVNDIGKENTTVFSCVNIFFFNLDQQFSSQPVVLQTNGMKFIFMYLMYSTVHFG